MSSSTDILSCIPIMTSCHFVNPLCECGISNTWTAGRLVPAETLVCWHASLAERLLLMRQFWPRQTFCKLEQRGTEVWEASNRLLIPHLISSIYSTLV